jgi:hypothetical protein
VRAGLETGYLNVALLNVTTWNEVRGLSSQPARRRAKDLLEDVVAEALESLGFNVRVDLRVQGRAGEVEVDVWGEKLVEDTRFAVSASCKNWDSPVDVSVVREELGRILQMTVIPHVRILVAPSFTDSARREAVADGFMVVEVGEKAHEGNIDKIYSRVYYKLDKLFTGVAPRRLQELADKVRELAERARRSAEEIEGIKAELERIAVTTRPPEPPAPTPPTPPGAPRGIIFQPEFIVDFKVKDKISEAVSQALKLDWKVDIMIADQLYRAVFEERNAEKTCELVKENVKTRWIILGVEPPAEELKLAEEVCSKIKELATRRASPVEWWKALEPVYTTREALYPSIKPYIERIAVSRIHKRIDSIVRGAKSKDIVVLTGEEEIRRAIPNLRIRFIEDMMPTDLIDMEALKERFREKIKPHIWIRAARAHELWYVNRIRRGEAEIPIMCVYDIANDAILACDRPALLVRYGEGVVEIAPIVLIKMVKGLYEKGILVESRQ